jgi:lactaldehyde reductase
LPAKLAASTGMDAMTHAIEGYVSLDWSPYQDGRSLVALRMIRDNLERAGMEAPDEDVRGSMLIAASLAITIGLGSAHSMSHSCGALFGVPHGIANAINLPHVVRFNTCGGTDIADRHRELNDVLGLESAGSDVDVGESLAAHLEGTVARMGLPTRLSQVGVPEDGVPALAEAAMGDVLTLLNPREPSEEDYVELFTRAL